MEENIFALDIGTRSVVGIILEKRDKAFQVIDLVAHEHDERSMVDGQIHDVLSVSKVIKEVKEKLEVNHGPLHKVCVAAAGRALKTKRTKVEKDIHLQPFMNHDDIVHLELSAVQQAQHTLAREEENANSTHYYCVGYSVIHYQLDGEDIGSLIDQQGKKASVEIIATFLPKVVVESLISALQRAGLEMEALTLEPIAAINVLIPPSMRRLNVALVDIGAGTSDIAITDLGTVTAYGMVPVAGDEITEAISDHYLLDFPLAEKAKRALCAQEKVTITDILGFESEVPYEEMVQAIASSIEKLANSIRDEILNLNTKPPKAVMLVGGGSLTPELTAQLAEKLSLPANRVAIRGIEAIQNLKKTDNLPEGPAFVTPIGIAIAAKQNPVQYVSVKVNNRAVRLFDMKKLTVGDCLLAAGVEMNKLYGRPGMAYIVTLNKKTITLPGGHGTAPIIHSNGETVSLEHPIQNGDIISVEEGTDGTSPTVTVEELVGELPTINVTWDEKPVKLEAIIHVNGHLKNKDYLIQDNDLIEVQTIKNIEDMLLVLGKSNLSKKLAPVEIFINNRKVILEHSIASLFRNANKASLKTKIGNGDHFVLQEQEPLRLAEFLNQLDLSFYYQIPITFNNQHITLKKPQVKVYRNGNELSKDAIINHHEHLTTEEFEVEPFIFQDVFRVVDIDLSNNKGKKFRVLKNGEECSFHNQLSPGDQLSIEWQSTISANE